MVLKAPVVTAFATTCNSNVALLAKAEGLSGQECCPVQPTLPEGQFYAVQHWQLIADWANTHCTHMVILSKAT